MAAILKFYVLAVTVISIVGLLYVYIKPPQSMRVDRQGVAHLTPQVMHAETGEPVALGELIRHYRGD